jgi:Zn finger protein HypA/HybF involved in hydrogenase expression
MHEMGIANSVLETVHREVRKQDSQFAQKVGLRIGEFAGVDPESLRFCTEAIVKSLEWPPLEVEIEWCREGVGGRRGDELEIAFIEIEDVDHESCGS